MKAFTLISTLLSLVLLTSCGKVEPPQFQDIENFKVQSLGLKETVIGLDVAFYNPNNYTIHVKEAATDIYIDSVYAGKFTQDQEVGANGKSRFSIPLTGTIPLSTALKLNLNKLVNEDILFKANGSVKIGRAGIFITKPFDYKGTHRIKQ